MSGPASAPTSAARSPTCSPVGDDGDVSFTKVLSTPPAYDRAVVDGGAPSCAARARRSAEVVHGTTVATNAVLERRGARTALVTTAGLPRRARAAADAHAAPLRLLLDEAAVARPAPRCRFEIAERMARRRRGAARRSTRTRRARSRRGSRRPSVESVAVCLLHAHLHPAHERRLGEILRAELPGMPVSLSSEILREQQEYERTATTVVNAYVAAADGPLRRRHPQRPRRRAGVAAPLTVMQSSGGVMTAADAAARPVYALESGPAAGVVAALVARARRSGIENAIAFDMGGTTAKASLIEDGRVSRSQEYEVGASLSAGSRLLRGSGELIRIPTIDIAEVGAGGGSDRLARRGRRRCTSGRAARAPSPGPACYGRGGDGADRDRRERRARLHPDRPARLRRPDRVARARRGGGRRGSARALGLSTLDEAARGIHDLANASMMRALRAVSTEKGRDPRDFALVAYGGSGPVHAAALAAELGVAHGDRAAARRALLRGRAALRARRVPRRALLPRRARASPTSTRCGGSTPRCAPTWRRGSARRAASGGASPTSATAARAGASRSSCPASSTRPAIAALVERFEAEHERLYGTRLEPGSPVEIRALRLAALGPPRASRFALPRGRARRAAARAAPTSARRTARSTRRSSRAPRSRPSRRPARCSSTSTTRRSSSRPAGRCASTPRAGALVLERVPVAPRRRRGPRRPTHADAIAQRLVGERARDRRPTRWRRRSSAPPTRPSCATRWTTRPRSAARAARRSRRRSRSRSSSARSRTRCARCSSASATSFRPGDVFIVNDPFDGASHTPDIFVVKPSFDGETLIGFARHGRAPRRRRRPRAGDDARATAPTSSRRACACRGCGSTRRASRSTTLVRDPPRERPHPARAARRPQRAGRRVHDRRPRAAGARRALRRRSGSRR